LATAETLTQVRVENVAPPRAVPLVDHPSKSFAPGERHRQGLSIAWQRDRQVMAYLMAYANENG
jgi:hypothetical protein